MQHGPCGLRDYIVQYAWNPSFGLLFFLFHYCTLGSAYTVWDVVVRYYAQHNKF